MLNILCWVYTYTMAIAVSLICRNYSVHVQGGQELGYLLPLWASVLWKDLSIKWQHCKSSRNHLWILVAKYLMNINSKTNRINSPVQRDTSFFSTMHFSQNRFSFAQAPWGPGIWISHFSAKWHAVRATLNDLEDDECSTYACMIQNFIFMLNWAAS